MILFWQGTAKRGRNRTLVFKLSIPQDGDKKVVKKFAFFPVRIDENNVIWLEHYYKELTFIDAPLSGTYWITNRIYRGEKQRK